MKSRLKWAGGCLIIVILATVFATNKGTPPTTYTSPRAGASHSAGTATVTYFCTGSAPDGVDITYGPEGSNYSASALPFTKTMPIPANTQYMSTQAQLQGSGSVTCSTTTNSNGQLVRQSGTASGGYNLASAELCESYDGTWAAC